MVLASGTSQQFHRGRLQPSAALLEPKCPHQGNKDSAVPLCRVVEVWEGPGRVRSGCGASPPDCHGLASDGLARAC